jgi:mRNA-degrading endonuclease RelE of RelBE toxin-antitoxin system
MWTVYEHRSLSKKLPKLPLEVLKRYEKWKDIITISGSEGLRLIKGFYDEPLKGEWAGYCSSRLGLQYRIIYKTERDKLFVLVIDINPHLYRRK